MSLNELYNLGLYNVNISSMSEKSCSITANINIEYPGCSGGKEFGGVKLNITGNTPDECLVVLLKKATAIQKALETN